MAAASWTIALGLVIVSAGGPSGRWLGQDGHDLVSASSVREPNGYQDIHIRINNVSPRRVIKSVEIRPEGGGIWSSVTSSNAWAIAVQRMGNAPAADLFFEGEYPEKGRPMHIKIDFQDGGTADLNVRGGRTDPSLRMPEAMPRIQWVGQDGQDYTVADLGVGPDGLQDARITLTNLPPQTNIDGLLLDAGAGGRYRFGRNPEGDDNAELIKDAKDPTIGQLYFQPKHDLAGRTLTVTIFYPNSRRDTLTVKAERTDPKLAMPSPSLPKLEPGTFEGRWLGQDGTLNANRREVHVALTGLPAGRNVAAAVLSDSIFGHWVYRRNPQVNIGAEQSERPLTWRPGSDSSTADLYFSPYRDEAGATLILRLIFENGESVFASIGAGACDPLAGLPQPAPTAVVAKPGDDLNDLTDRFGTVTLASGTHRLTKPLILNKPVTLAGEPGAIVEFAQGAEEPPWTTAIKIHCGSTTLRDFAVRFAGPVRWTHGVNRGPAVIGTTDNLEPPRSDPKIGLTFERLDLAGPPASGKEEWENAVLLMRLNTAPTGRIAGCTLFGGTIEFYAGPWQFVDNVSRGTPRGTFSHGVVAGQFVHDVLVRGNQVKPIASSGKVWRFVAIMGYGRSVQIENNTVEGVGPRDDDKIPSHNAPEIILTESYRLQFEGRPSAVSSEGRVLTINRGFGGAPEIGAQVAVLSGTRAGEWRTIAQQVAPSSYLLDAPLPADASVVSICPGFVNMRIEGNTVLAREARRACCLVVPGNHFGTVIRKNRFIGSGEIIRITAAASETPMIWGWSRAPYFGGLFEENVLEDAVEGGLIGVEHSKFTKAVMGRTYMTISLKNNLVRWSPAFLRQRARSKEKTPLRGYTFGYLPSFDPDELVVTQQGDRLEAPAAAQGEAGVFVNAALINGRRVGKQGFRLPAASDSNQVPRATQQP